MLGIMFPQLFFSTIFPTSLHSSPYILLLSSLLYIPVYSDLTLHSHFFFLPETLYTSIVIIMCYNFLIWSAIKDMVTGLAIHMDTRRSLPGNIFTFPLKSSILCLLCRQCTSSNYYAIQLPCSHKPLLEAHGRNDDEEKVEHLKSSQGKSVGK